MTAPFLSVQDLVVSYGDFRAVDGVSFDIPKGGTLAVVGESGCGKSTIARALVRLVTPTSGAIVLDGTDIAQLKEKQLRPLRHRVQMVFQDPYGSLDPHLTAEKIVAEPMRDRSKADRHRRPRGSSTWSGCRPRRWTAVRPSSPAGSASGSASPGRWPPAPTCWCSTRPPARWT